MSFPEYRFFTVRVNSLSLQCYFSVDGYFLVVLTSHACLRHRLLPVNILDSVLLIIDVVFALMTPI